MPLYHVDGSSFDIPRDSVLLDTNVLVAAFWDRDPEHNSARYFIDEFPHQWLVPAAVVVETWGLIVGSKKDLNAGYEFLSWLNTPGRAVVVLPQSGSFSSEQAIVQALHVDCVDAVIVNLANTITVSCDLRPSLPIATYDTKDFLRLKMLPDSRFNLIDMRSGDLQDLDFG
jgi:predicted nucleic acid-binding protein